jgi:hypothetical protein
MHSDHRVSIRQQQHDFATMAAPMPFASPEPAVPMDEQHLEPVITSLIIAVSLPPG